MNINYKQQYGFTLVELVTIIVILGILATSMTSFMRFGVQSYTDSADREEIISNARFIVERLNREVRDALPNSVRIIGTLQNCLEFIPVNESAIYLDIPVAPEAVSNAITLVPFASSNINNSSRVSVYALHADQAYNTTPGNGVIGQFDPNTALSLAPLYAPAALVSTATPVILTLNNAMNFTSDSPTQRLYFTENPVSYCFENNEIFRYENYIDTLGDYDYDNDDTPSVTSATRVLMAQNVTNAIFSIIDPMFQRNDLVQVRLAFERNLETIVFNNEIQVTNVP